MARDRLAAMRVSFLQPSLLVNRKVACKLPILQQTSSGTAIRSMLLFQLNLNIKLSTETLELTSRRCKKWLTECLSLSPSSILPPATPSSILPSGSTTRWRKWWIRWIWWKCKQWLWVSINLGYRFSFPFSPFSLPSPICLSPCPPHLTPLPFPSIFIP